MAIIPTGAIYKSLVFDGESSRDYGIYITGQAVYNAPERDVEMISIPGRNGSFALDKGRFQNIEVTYPAGIFADNEADFAQGISDFRNFLCSRNGYVRLTDDYNPDEYRMAVYKSGLDVSPAQLRAGEFDITFDCKPQRFLLSGEEAIDVSSGDVILNPTLFESSPMLEVEGYGSININSETIAIENVPYGEIVIGGPINTTITNSEASNTIVCEIDTDTLESGDYIYVKNVNATINYSEKAGYTLGACTIGLTSLANATTNANGTVRTIKASVPRFYYGTSDSSTAYVTFNESWTYNGNSYTNSQTVQIKTEYDGASTLSFKVIAMTSACYNSTTSKGVNTPQIVANSTMSALGHPTYIDLDIGEAYNIVSGEAVSLNNVVQMPAELPKLKSGANTITADNTVTDLKVIPRWWKI